ncbi:F-box and associated interaction domains-containing protein putative isoform 1 [Tripterygium wilfordii]|uniref:F-box and associated interaction domains-containing protein putative isoform 1 n=1 Tax=Tripterygium wilfordii TaxID=458696 RepID=A0A7J7CPV9_TRIWF|nr:F-box and associated interaction domains-containing protein putative isoform 1 [Tripterygium wilfordii]
MKMNNIPEDLVTDILTRLPIKSLIRFAGVCSSWLDLIRNPDFIKSHHLKQTSLNDNNFRVFVMHDYNCLSLLTEVADDQEGAFDFLESVGIPLRLVVMGHCNGLLCLHDQWEKIFIWNPVTREVKALPFLSHIMRPICTESTSFRNFGFGFDHKTGDYKVIRFADNYYDDSLDSVVQVELYSLNNNSWREYHPCC